MGNDDNLLYRVDKKPGKIKSFWNWNTWNTQPEGHNIHEQNKELAGSGRKQTG